MELKYNGTVAHKAAAIAEQHYRELQMGQSTGRFSQVLKELAEEADFKYLLGHSEGTPAEQELVLRFASFYFNTYQGYYGPVKEFLNDTLAKYRDIAPRDEVRLRADFRNSIQIIRYLFGKSAFRRFYRGDEKNKNGKWETGHFNVALFDILMYSFAKQNITLVLPHKDRIDEALIDLMTTDQEFIDSIEMATGSRIIVASRFEKWCQALQTILDKGVNIPGTFNYQLKYELFTASSTCALCNRPIHMFDDSTFVHLQNYWVGDKLISDQAKLAHRYCKYVQSIKK
ncbi:MAG TPA: hypothetical protein VFG54_03195 [Prolixibacteraceae bacterium]|nr:hypothetical protein [Prolixibacteraceae bacterium]